MTTLAEAIRELERWHPLPGSPFQPHFAALVRNEHLHPDQIAAAVDRQVAQTVSQAARAVPWVQRVLAERGLEAQDVRSLAELPSLPILTKLDVVEHGEELQAVELPPGERIVQETRSSGTTGRVARVLHTGASTQTFALLAHRRARWARMDPTGTYATIRIPSHFPRSEGGQVLQDGEVYESPRWTQLGQFFFTGPAVGFNLSNPVEQQLAWLRAYQPQVLATYPGSFEELAFANGCRSPSDTIRWLHSTGSSITPAARRQVERMYAAPLQQVYGINEIGKIGIRCEAGRYHIHIEHCVVEVVDPDGRPAAPGALGRVLVTSVNNHAMPLLRYDTEDVARAVEGPCPCGRTLPAIGEIEGRFRRFACLPLGTRPRLNTVIAAIEGLPDAVLSRLRQYQLHQQRDHRWELRVRSAGGMDPAFETAIQAAWAAVPGAGDTPLTVVEVDALTATPSGKILDFTSDFYPDPHEELDPAAHLAALQRIAREEAP